MKHVHKPHELPSAMDSNAAQFERQGNPWHGERVKVGRRKRRVPTCRPGLPRVPERQSRTESEAFLDVQCKRAIDALVKAASGNSRTAKALETRARPIVAKVRPPRDAELSQWDGTRIESEIARLERQAKQARIEAKVKLGDIRAAALAELEALAL